MFNSGLGGPASQSRLHAVRVRAIGTRFVLTCSALVRDECSKRGLGRALRPILL